MFQVLLGARTETRSEIQEGLKLPKDFDLSSMVKRLKGLFSKIEFAFASRYTLAIIN
jgi:hypothetical protein